jgi:SAM-dependent methyltransferase
MSLCFLRRAVNLRHKFLHRKDRSLPGCFQPYAYTRPNRYPWLFDFATTQLGADKAVRLLSFGCSRGDEVFTLQSYFPRASIKGLDVNPDNIAHCNQRIAARRAAALSFSTAADTRAEPDASYDAVFCLAVLCCGDLTVERAVCSAPRLHFRDFERVVSDLARCVKPGGLLVLHTTNYRFSDTAASANFEAVFHATSQQMAPDLLYGCDNRLLDGERYLAVGFRRKH